MKNRYENPLVIQSRQWLLSALIELMREKSFQSISIKELATRAGLDRKTFYRHFKTKEDVLGLLVKEACDNYIAKLKELPALTSSEIAKSYFSICEQYKDYLCLINSNGLFPLLLTKFNEYLPNLNEIFQDNPTYHFKSQYELMFQAGGFWNITAYWINTGAKQSPDEMAQIVSTIMPYN